LNSKWKAVYPSFNSPIQGFLNSIMESVSKYKCNSRETLPHGYGSIEPGDSIDYPPEFIGNDIVGYFITPEEFWLQSFKGVNGPSYWDWKYLHFCGKIPLQPDTPFIVPSTLGTQTKVEIDRGVERKEREIYTKEVTVTENPYMTMIEGLPDDQFDDFWYDKRNHEFVEGYKEYEVCLGAGMSCVELMGKFQWWKANNAVAFYSYIFQLKLKSIHMTENK